MAPKSVPCPTCRRPTPWDGNPYRPFCSQRCRVTDIGNWAQDRYRIAGPPLEEAEDAPADDPDGEGS